MPVAKQHKSATRRRIIDGAGRLFRRFGHDAVSIDEVMAEAGLTRGGFYAYFRSKEELFDAVVQQQALLARIERCDGDTKRQRRKAVLAVFEAYLSPDEAEANAAACGFVGLGADVGRIKGESRRLYAEKLEALAEAICAVLSAKVGEDRGHAVAAQAIGALFLARACGEARTADRVLGAALAQVRRILR
jgi:TetR/AcrR family transcriptional repressor of nem operon